MKPLKNIGGILPTIFNLGEVWKLNSERCGGKFNLIFFWLYPIAALVLLPLTMWCLVEWFFDR